jgi:chromate reductase
VTTATTNIGVIIGSLARDSINRRLAGRLAELAPPGLALTEISIRDLPLYSYDLDAGFPGPARRFKAAVSASDALLIVTPEYNRSVPGPLKNALDWGSRPWGDNSWHGKKAAITGTGLNPAGTAVAQAHLRGILGYLGMTVMGAPETCVPWREGILSDPETAGYLTAFQHALTSHVAPAPARPGAPLTA